MARNETVLLEAEFDPAVQPYGRWWVTGLLLITVAGIPLIPFWLLFSLWFVPAYYRSLSARLTERSLEIQRGVFTKSEATIPLDRITDLRLHHGPIMRRYGIRGLRVETAGSGGPNANAEGNLYGIVDTEAFRDAVLNQRDRVTDGGGAAPAAPAPASSDASVLEEIRDLLKSIDSKTG